MVGSGPNGLAAAITLAQAGLKTVLREAQATVGGGLRCDELTLPGFVHDTCSSVHPLGVASPFFRGQNLPLRWVHAPTPLAHVLPGGRAVTLERSLAETADRLGVDGPAYRRLFEPLVERFET